MNVKKQKKILVVEDEVKIGRFIELELHHEGYFTEYEADGQRAYELIMAEEADYDLILLDWMLPGMSGLEICQKVRQVSEVPIIMLTARGDVKDRVKGIAAGANDYLTKPFAMEELVARVGALLRTHQRESYIYQDNEVMTSGDVVMETSAHVVKLNGQQVDLTKTEFRMLELLMRNKNCVVPRDKILSNIWDSDYRGDTNAIDVYIRYLRQKLEIPNDNKRLIYTVRGIGYVVKD